MCVDDMCMADELHASAGSSHSRCEERERDNFSMAEEIWADPAVAASSKLRGWMLKQRQQRFVTNGLGK